MTTEHVTLLTVLAGFLYQGWREWRKEQQRREQRTWDLEDRKALREAVADNTVHTIEAKQQAQQAYVKGEEAWTEANNLTNKFIEVVQATKLDGQS